MDREALLRRRRELYRQRRDREMPEEREVRLSRRRDYYRRRRAALSTEEHVDRSELGQNSGRSADQGCVELPRFDHPDVTAKITEFHTYVDSLQSAKCEVCLEQFPNLRHNSSHVLPT